ncbi:unnamed protein product [Symbiodinium sp. CCMP2592]|nr:unnamed protein product [Symbiodinium sp. CCMP2592]
MRSQKRATQGDQVDKVGCADWGPFAGPDRSIAEVREDAWSWEELRLKHAGWKSSQCEAGAHVAGAGGVNSRKASKPCSLGRSPSGRARVAGARAREGTALASADRVSDHLLASVVDPTTRPARRLHAYQMPPSYFVRPLPSGASYRLKARVDSGLHDNVTFLICHGGWLQYMIGIDPRKSQI